MNGGSINAVTECQFTSARELSTKVTGRTVTPFPVNKKPIFSSPGVNYGRSEPIRRSRVVDSALPDRLRQVAGPSRPSFAKRERTEGDDQRPNKRASR